MNLDIKSRPLFGQWLKKTWLDLLTMAILGAVGLTIFKLPPLQPRMFPLLDSDGEVTWPQFAYPRTTERLPIWLVVLLVTSIPVSIILLCQIRIRSFWDANNAFMGLLYSLNTAAVFQVFIKWLIGGLRPQFFAICKPEVGRRGAGYQDTMYSKDVCNGDLNEIQNALDSFPSGHSTAAFAGFVFLSLYLNAKFKVFANYQPRMWKLLLFLAPILGATLIAAQMVADYSHNWYDVCAGAVIGIIMAFGSFRTMYASIWDFRTNHIVLLPNVANDDVQQFLGLEHITQAVCTRKAGWGPGTGISAPRKAPETQVTTTDGFEKVEPESNNGSSGDVGQATGTGSPGEPLVGSNLDGGERQRTEEPV